MLKRGFILLLATIIALFSTTIVFADQHSPDKGDFGNQNGIVPFYVGISNISTFLTFSNGNASPEIDIKVREGYVNKAIFTVELQKNMGNRFTTIKTWRDKTVYVNSQNHIIFSESYSATPGEYRITYSGKCYKGTAVVDTFSGTTKEYTY